MTNIETLVDDIANILSPSNHTEWAEHLSANFGTRLSGHVSDSIGERSESRSLGKLWASDLGKPCNRQLYYQFHNKGESEPIPYQVQMKFLYGDFIEELTLELARLAGHSVENEQQRYELALSNGWQVSGRIDAVLDGIAVDVKSMSTPAFKKFQSMGVNAGTDLFGYRHQVDFYRLMEGLETGAILGVDKTLGHVGVFFTDPVWETKEEMADHAQKMAQKIEASAPPERLPNAEVPEGKSGNLRLCTTCSYCSFKQVCFPSLRTFGYSKGPVYLSNVVKEPKVPEFIA